MTSQITSKSYNLNGGNLDRASRQWATRPADQRFDTLEALLDATRRHRAEAVEASVHARDLRAEAQGDEVVVVGKAGKPALLTHYAFGQVASRAGAPASYLRKLTPALAASCLNEGLQARASEREDDSPEALLLRREDNGGLRLHAALSESYRRVWNHEVADVLVSLRERQPAWDFPVAHRSAARMTGTGTGEATWGTDEGRKLPCAFASDHDLFVFLTDQQRTVEVNGASLFRGFFVENSEVGAASFRLTLFLYDAVCSNLIVWGVKHVREVALRHVGRIRDEVLGSGSTVLPVLTAYAESSAAEQQAQITRAQRTLVADTRAEVVSTILGKRISGITGSALEGALDVAEATPRYGDPRSVWGVVQGLTEYSQRTAHADERIALDRAAGRVMQIAF
jgi:hypothetical protein